MTLDGDIASASQVKPQERKQLVVEWHRGVHVSDGDFYVINKRFHRAYLPASSLENRRVVRPPRQMSRVPR